MTQLILGTGLGSFILISTWSLALVLCLISLRTQRSLGLISIICASLITCILFSIPRGNYEEVTKSPGEVYDGIFIWRTGLLVSLILSSVIGFGLFITNHLMEPKQVQAVKGWHL